jgi:RHS repeat-associated protein
MRDAQRNVKSLEYDSLQRVRAVRDPDRGVKVYVYDDASNLVRTVDAKGQVIQYRYDFCDRLVEEVHGESGSGVPRRVVYRYDVPSEDLGVAGERVTAAFTRGRLAAVVDSSGETHFSYDARGNRDWIVNRIREPRSGLLVSYLTRFAYDLLDRATEVVFPDGDRVRQIYGDGEALQHIDGGPRGVALVNDVRHHPSGQVARIEYANGVTSSYTFDARDRLSTLLTRGPSGDALIDNEYRYDPASNVVAIVDRRPIALTGADSPRRNTQVFEYDALHRLTSVRYTAPDDLAQNLGQIDYAYDAIGNLVAKSTPAPGQPGHLASLDLALGEITYGAGKSEDRTPRQPWDPPGPHAATRTASGRVYEYDANGNMTSRDGARLTWDDKDQLVGYEVGATAASYVYDYADRRVAKSVETSSRKSETTIYVNAYYEERPGGTPVKFVFDGATRVARVEGSIDTDSPKIQRIRLASGWNAVTAAVNAGGTLAQVFGAEATCYAFRDGRYEVLAANERIVPGEPLWVHSLTARLCVLKGAEFAPLGPTPVPNGGGWLAWASLQAFQPRVHLSAAARTIAYDSDATRWLLHDESLPSFLQDFSGVLPSAGALWIDAAPGTLLLPPPPRSPRVLFYHGDHLGSTSVVSDEAGRLHEEIAYYPFGQIRNRYLATEGAPAVEHDFTGKETDTESGLTQLGARSYDAVLGRFASVDPRLGNPAVLDAEPARRIPRGAPETRALFLRPQ